MTDLLTPAEHHALALTADLANLTKEIIANGSTRNDDDAEITAHIHVIQHTIMAQAAARAYPEQYRLLGEGNWPSSHDGEHEI